ncbi:hypothetical protein HYV87_00080 [Candidatus Woesearchaeota archaeon]|nr:hypothetical protein [Candidatus Woesearchaeota archaeon]
MKQKRGSCSTSLSSLCAFSRPIQSKNGQVTIFIIIGIVVLFVFSGILYVTKVSSKEELTSAGEPVIAAVPQEFQPIQTYTEDCLAQVGRRGLLVLGQQGGYIYPELIGRFSSSDPTNADGLDLEPVKVPYWHYNLPSNDLSDVSYSSLQPPLHAQDDPEISIEAQLSRFAEENLNGCIGNYAGFSEQGFTIEAPALVEGVTSGKEVLVTIADETVNFWLKMEVEASKGDATVEMNQFYIKTPVRLKHYYDVAAEIAKVESEHNFLELQALDLITAYASVDINKLPPMEQITFDFVPTVSWAETDVKEKLRSLLTSSVPLLRYLQSTNFYRFEYTPEESATVDLHELYQKHYDNMILPLETGKNIEVNFDYFGWEPYFDMNDKAGQIVPSSYHAPSATPLPPIPLTVNHYYSTYDVSYPVLVTIRDPAALEGRGYTFAFALEANIRNNAIPAQGYSQPAPIALEQKSMVCDPEKRNTQPLKTVVVDSATQEPLEAVQIGFSIPEQDDCLMGLTDNGGEFESKYPAVYGGVASFIKDEYLTNFYPVDTYRFRESPGVIGYATAANSEMVVPLHKRKFINVSFRQKSIEKCVEDDDGKNKQCFTQGLFATGLTPVYSYLPETLDQKHSWIFPNTARALEEKETATIVLKRVMDTNPNAFSDQFSASATVQGNTQARMELVPGVYEVTALLTRSEPLVIPEEERCAGLTCFTLGEQVLDEFLSGQLRWDQPKNYLTVTPEQLYGADEMVFTILSFNLAGVPAEEHLRIIEDLQMMGETANLSQQLRANLEPTFR